MSHSGFSGIIGVAREDITPPAGIYCRNWGAAAHDAAEGIHRPLTLSALILQSQRGSAPLVLIDADLGWWVDLPFERQFRRRLLAELKLAPAQLIFAMTHTHSAPPLCLPEPHWHGGELLPAFTEKVYAATVRSAHRALECAQAALLEWHFGKCNLATNRDLRDGKRIVCGHNPGAKADDTLLLGRVSDAAGNLLATLVNYACHPTTLAWQNRLASPDYVGAMRQTIEQSAGGLALFMQGASGELAPRQQYTGDTRIADAHGRQLAFAALSTLTDMENPGQKCVFDRIVESGAPLATWKSQPAAPSRDLRSMVRTVDLPLKNWPIAAELERQYKSCSDRALAERLRRKLRIREAIGDEATYPLELWAWRIGDAIIAGAPVEAYSDLQRDLRAAFPDRAIVWMNLINGSIGYLPPADLYDEDLYQVWQTPFDRGSLECLTRAAVKTVQELIAA